MRRIGALFLLVLVFVSRPGWPQGMPLGEFRQDGSTYGAFGQRYGQIVPIELMDVRVE